MNSTSHCVAGPGVKCWYQTVTKIDHDHHTTLTCANWCAIRDSNPEPAD